MKKVMLTISLLLFVLVLQACVKAPDFSDGKVSIVFFTNLNATYIPTEIVDYGHIPIKPEDPLRPGAEFIGWSYRRQLNTAGEVFTGEFNFDLPIYESVVIYAWWEYVTYTITWHNITADELAALGHPTTFTMFTGRIDFREPPNRPATDDSPAMFRRGWFATPDFSGSRVQFINPQEPGFVFENLDFYFFWLVT